MFALLSLTAHAQKESGDVRKGNKYYEEEKYTESEVEYRRGLDKNKESFEAMFNLGNALYRQGKHKEAAEQYQAAGGVVADDAEKMASVQHNIGNAQMAQQQFDQAIETYKRALRLNPKDDETRYNLAYAQEQLQQQQQQQQQQDNKDEKQEEQKDQQQQQDQQDQEKKEQEQEQQQQQQQQQDQQQMSKENAEQLLEALLQDEKETQEKAKKAQIKGAKKSDKDW